MTYGIVARLLGRVIDLPYVDIFQRGDGWGLTRNGWGCVCNPYGASLTLIHECPQCKVLPGNQPPGGISMWPDLSEVGPGGLLACCFGMHGAFTVYRLLGYAEWKRTFRPQRIQWGLFRQG